MQPKKVGQCNGADGISMLERLTPEHVFLYKSTNKHIDETVKMLNETLGTCLR